MEPNAMFENIKMQTKTAMSELLAVAKLKEKDIFVVGCSSSEILGQKIGTCSSMDAAAVIFDEIYAPLRERGAFLAVQCCEHLNRALILEEECALHYGYDIVNVVPHPHAGGAFATTAYSYFTNPVAVEAIKANAGLDIGDTLIGMHLKSVAVPVRVSVSKIGEANLVLARTRPKFMGGERAMYNKEII